MRISFVVPTRNSGRTIEACVRSLAQQLHPDVEIVVVDNGSTDETRLVAARWADLVVEWGPERSAQRNRGTLMSSGEVVVFVDSDMVLEPVVATAIESAFLDDPDVGALIIPERSFGEGFLSACRALEKSLYVGDDTVEAPRAFRREVLARVGGWDERLTAAEDWDLADRTRAAGVTVSRVDAWIWHDEGRLRLRGTFAKKRYYGRWVGAYLYQRPSGRRHLARTALLRCPGRLVRHPLRTAGMVGLKSVEAAGIYAGVRDARKTVGAEAAA